MNDAGTDREKLARTWIALTNLPERSAEREQYFWAFVTVDGLVRDHPEEAWTIIRLILSLDASEVIAANLAAGPLENLIVYHGALFIDRIEAASVKDAAFKAVLSHVWKNNMKDEIWSRLKSLTRGRP